MIRSPRLTAYRNPPRAGHSLLELVAATTLLAIALIPALRMMRDSMRIGRDLESNGLMTTLCVGKMEEQLAKSGATWTLGTVTGDFAAEGYAHLHFNVNKSDAVADGGIVDQLMSMTVVVWDDLNSNSLLDGNEPNVTFASKIAKLQSYQNQASGS